MSPIADLARLLAGLTPVLNDGVFAFCSLATAADAAALHPVATFREKEGLTVVVESSVAEAHGLTVHFHAAWITLAVNSDLAAVGLTAAVSGALAEAGISCNVIAAVHHDHLFVPVDRGADTVAVLEALQRSGAVRCSPSTQRP